LKRTPLSLTWYFITPLGQGWVEHRRAGVADEAAEFRDKGGGSDWLRPARRDLFDAHAQNIALFGAFDRDRAVLRVDERELELLRRLVVDGLYRAPESVERLGDDDIARRDREHGRGVRPVHILIGALLLLCQVVRLAGAAARDPPASHIRGGKPVRHPMPPKRASGATLSRRRVADQWRCARRLRRDSDYLAVV
jgi:hypothetical protein